ncbi:MAG: HIT family protein [bacterium]|jgi:histidine triad (HIT) family protein
MSYNPDCIFCKIAAGEIPCHKIYEDELFIGFLDIFPMDVGHSLLLPKEHAANLLELSDTCACALGKTAVKFGALVKKGTGADALNISSNIGKRAGQIVMHAHLHFIPRYEGEEPINWEPQNCDSEILEATAKKIRGEF